MLVAQTVLAHSRDEGPGSPSGLAELAKEVRLLANEQRELALRKWRE